MKIRSLRQNDTAVSHQLVSIASISIFICVVLATVINSVPVSPDTTSISDMTDKQSMALQISTMLIDTPGLAPDSSTTWESSELTTRSCLPYSVGFRLNPGYSLTISESNYARILSWAKIHAIDQDVISYDDLQTEIFGLPSYINFNINVNFADDSITDVEYGPSLDYSKLLVTKTISVVIYDDLGSESWDYEYATLQVKIG